jgi:Arc/MetJ-type ribon-helix-helix transcriptional regulator
VTKKKKLVTKPPLEAGKLRKTTTISLSETDMRYLDALVGTLGLSNRSAVVRFLMSFHAEAVIQNMAEAKRPVVEVVRSSKKPAKKKRGKRA